MNTYNVKTRRPWAAKDIADDEMLLAVELACANRDMSFASLWDIAALFPRVPEKVVRAKCIALAKQGKLNGCETQHNCRGDYSVVSEDA